MKIKTDNKWHEILYFSDLPETEQDELRQDYDYLDEDTLSLGWVKWNTSYFHLEDFLKIDIRTKDLNKWDGIYNFTYDSGLFLKINNSGDKYKIAYFYGSDEAEDKADDDKTMGKYMKGKAMKKRNVVRKKKNTYSDSLVKKLLKSIDKVEQLKKQLTQIKNGSKKNIKRTKKTTSKRKTRAKK